MGSKTKEEITPGLLYLQEVNQRFIKPRIRMISEGEGIRTLEQPPVTLNIAHSITESESEYIS